MRFLCLASLLAVASAFTTQPNAFTSVNPSVAENVVAEQSNAHRSRKATIVMDGKANGTFYVDFVLDFRFLKSADL